MAQKVNANHNYVSLVIHPTKYGDFDVLAIGDYKLLLTLAKKNKHSQLILKSKFGGIPILILDTCDTLRQALSCLKTYRNRL